MAMATARVAGHRRARPDRETPIPTLLILRQEINRHGDAPSLSVSIRHEAVRPVMSFLTTLYVVTKVEPDDAR